MIRYSLLVFFIFHISFVFAQKRCDTIFYDDNRSIGEFYVRINEDLSYMLTLDPDSTFSLSVNGFWGFLGKSSIGSYQVINNRIMLKHEEMTHHTSKGPKYVRNLSNIDSLCHDTVLFFRGRKLITHDKNRKIVYKKDNFFYYVRDCKSVCIVNKKSKVKSMRNVGIFWVPTPTNCP